MELSLGEPISPRTEETKQLAKKRNENDRVEDTESIHDNPYAYLNRNGFTSEKFKIEIRNLPKYYGIKELKKLLNTKLKLNLTKIKIPSQKSCRIYVCFKCEEDKLHALKELNRFKWKGCSLTANEAKPVPDPLIQKRISGGIQAQLDCGKIKDEEELQKRIKDVTTPLWKIPYSMQLEKKKELIFTLLKQYGHRLVKTNQELGNWCRIQKEKFQGLPCEVLPIRCSNIIDGYRNKCEFSIGFNDVTGKRTIGFRLGSYVKGSVAVAPIDDVPNVPHQMKVVVNLFQEFIRKSKYEVFNSESQQGHWKQLTVRLGFRTNELMVIIGVDPQQMTNEELNSLKEEIKEYFTRGEGVSSRVHSLYLQQIKRKRNNDEEPVYDHIFGQTHITEILLGKRFRISPQAFFQVNTSAAETLYESIGELAGLNENVTLLDVCCGTGTIGLSLSEKCGQVLGIEKSPEAVADAKANAQLNNVANAEFYAGKAEEILSCVSYKANKEEVIAVVDPPRAGLQHDAVVQIRKNERIKKLIYISCDPGRAMKNFVDFGRPTSKIYKREPFVPLKAVPVDLFPHTDHCELIIFFQRLSL